jgi:hypothetical protein
MGASRDRLHFRGDRFEDSEVACIPGWPGGGRRISPALDASKRKGLWAGGMVPLGYVSRDKKLVIEEDEAERVRTIFQRG